MDNRDCPICGCKGNKIFDSRVLKKYDVNYFQCPNCAFVYTEEPYWLAEAYKSAILDADTGIMVRNIFNAVFIRSVIEKFFGSKETRCVDYGGVMEFLSE